MASSENDGARTIPASGDNPDVFIMGNGIFLRALKEADLNGNWYRWLNDPEVTDFQDKGYFPNTREKQASYYESIKDGTSDVVLAIVEIESNRHIGGVGLHHISWIHRHAELGIMIGEKDYWGKGYGGQAWRMITAYGFEVLNLHKIYSTVLDGNEPSLRSALASGYEVEGTFKEHTYKHGRYHDLTWLAVTRATWFENNPAENDANRRRERISAPR